MLVARLCIALKIDVAQLEGRLHILDASDIVPALHREQRATFDGLKTFTTETRLLSELSILVQKLDVGLVVIDNAATLMTTMRSSAHGYGASSDLYGPASHVLGERFSC